jgi:hypothetical protein
VVAWVSVGLVAVAVFEPLSFESFDVVTGMGCTWPEIELGFVEKSVTASSVDALARQVAFKETISVIK